MYEKGYVDSADRRVAEGELRRFAEAVFASLGVPPANARIAADVLVTADLRGVESHGVQRLGRYVRGLRSGAVQADAAPAVVREGPCHAVVDGRGGLGQVAGAFAMDLACGKAEKNGVGVVCVRNSNHYGIAGWYALRAVDRGLIGVSLTTSRPLVAPTHATAKALGTNPISVGVPTSAPPPFLLDMATSVAPSGKLEVCRRRGETLPIGWVVGPGGEEITDPDTALSHGALFPLGGRGETYGGHKGYGLAVVVDILAGLLGGGPWSRHVGETHEPRAEVGHFFMAVDPDAFTSRADLAAAVDGMRAELRGIGESERVWTHGEKGWATQETRRALGIPLHRGTLEELDALARELGVPPIRR